MQSLDQELNQMITSSNPTALELLSAKGKRLFMPKGIVTQSAEAKQKAHKYNATIGMANENGQPMYLKSIYSQINSLSPKEVFPYAPTDGVADIRALWKVALYKNNPSLTGKLISTPLVTSGITHGLSLCSQILTDPDDIVIVPDKYWGNYKMIFSTLAGANLKIFPFFNHEKEFNISGLKETIKLVCQTNSKAIIILNFPNNPTGYSLLKSDAPKLTEVFRELAESGHKMTVICDDSYFGLFYEEKVLQESIFAYIADLHKNLLAVKLCGITKEYYAWGLRLGFLTYGASGENVELLYNALEQKTKGCIRGSISNANFPSQNLFIKALKSPTIEDEKAEKYKILKDRANEIKKILDSGSFQDRFSYYPFNAGYFMCLKLHHDIAETLRIFLLDTYGIGTIASGPCDLRIAFSCIEKESLQEIIEKIYSAYGQVQSG